MKTIEQRVADLETRTKKTHKLAVSTHMWIKKVRNKVLKMPRDPLGAVVMVAEESGSATTDNT